MSGCADHIKIIFQHIQGLTSSVLCPLGFSRRFIDLRLSCETTQRITNSNLSDIQWLQASLPVKGGGLGVRRVSSLAIPAYLASAATTLSFQADILSGCACTDGSYLQPYLSSWSSSFGAISDTLPARQPFWDRSGIQADRLLVESSLSSAFQRASFLAASSKHSGGWLYVLPVTSCGMRLDDEAVRVA